MVAHAPALPAREVVRRFWPDARPFRRWLPLALALIAAGVAVETAEIFLFKLVVDDVLVPGDLGPLLWIGAACVGLLLLGGAIALGRRPAQHVARRALPAGHAPARVRRTCSRSRPTCSTGAASATS